MKRNDKQLLVIAKAGGDGERERDSSWGKLKEIAPKKPHNQTLQLLSAPHTCKVEELSLHHKLWFSQVLASCSQTVLPWPGYLTSLHLCCLSYKINDGALSIIWFSMYKSAWDDKK